jgi:hypothetical protein
MMATKGLANRVILGERAEESEKLRLKMTWGPSQAQRLRGRGMPSMFKGRKEARGVEKSTRGDHQERNPERDKEGWLTNEIRACCPCPLEAEERLTLSIPDFWAFWS